MISEQDGCCAICRKVPKAFWVDHCHNSKTVRGLLCSGCNTAIGLLKDDPELIGTALNYVSHRPYIQVLESA
jgi:hypothetical protein